ncbi:MAG: hypothetical protein JO165_10400 [Candidatus Eremiobacteraeota bacterium]|nr:hypothetical protein [Candidatus Eremiobacteraeota bacterium]
MAGAFIIAALIGLNIVGPAPALALSGAREGCMNQWMFNGVWRAEVKSVAPLMDGSRQVGWQVTQAWRNGTSRELAPADSLLKEEELVLGSQTLPAEGHRQEGLAFNTLAPSGEFTYTQVFYGPNGTVDPADKPRALDVSFEGDKVAASNKPHFTTRQYNFHYKLDCVASGAAAQAEGGSTQLAATNGCMNQWMSNGVWKMRVLAVTPFPEGTTAANQTGWHVKQEWVNVTSGKVYPNGMDPGNHVAPTSVSDEFLATKNGNNASSANTVGGFALGSRNIPFPPGVPYTFEQLIAWSPLDASDTPTRLLVTFDTVQQNKWKLSIPVPHYRNPANFRISLACGGNVVSAPGVSASAAQPQTTQPQQQRMAAAPQQSSGSPGKVDPCAMLAAPDVASALGVGVRSLGTPQRPSANECAWPIAAHAGTPAQTVVLSMQSIHQSPCRGLNCLRAVQSVLNLPGAPGLPSQFADAFNDAQLIAGLGDKASWKDGRLTVVKADMAFQLFVRGSASPGLSETEALARTVLGRI